MDEMMKKTEELCEKYGWTMECYSPFELRHEDGSFATGQAAQLVLQECKEAEKYIAGEVESPNIRVHYMTEFGGQITIKELEDILSFSKRFKILSLQWAE